MDGSAFLASFAAASSSSSAPLKSLSGQQWVTFDGVHQSFPVSADQVFLSPHSSGDHDLGSSNLKLGNLVNYAWPTHFSPGQLLCVRPPRTPTSGALLAYAIVTAGKNESVVRVVHTGSENRTLLKGIKGKVVDLAFAHTRQEILLGCVDEFGHVYVFSITENSDKDLDKELVLEIHNDGQEKASKNHRILWCPYLPDDEEDEDSPASKVFVVTHDCTARILNVEMVIEEYGSGPLKFSQIEVGQQRVEEHEKAITDAAFSPDGTALSTASADGRVKFFQVYIQGSEVPRCLHQWSPHDGEPVTSLLFLDDHKDHRPDVQFWKYALTGSNFNSELKIWSCETWSCLQTISFKPIDGEPSVFKVALDQTAGYLLLSDIKRKNVYVLQLSETEKGMKVVAVSEFATPSQFLYMDILEAGIKRVTNGHTLSEDEEDRDEDDTFDDEDNDMGEGDNDSNKQTRDATVISLYLIQPKSLQSCRIMFDSALQVVPIRAEEVEDIPIKKEIPDMIHPTAIKVETSNFASPSSKDQQKLISEATDKMTLMSPEDFSGRKIPIKEEENDLVNDTLLDPVQIKKEIESEEVEKFKRYRSGGSSPSREVQDILGDSEEQGGLGAEIIVTEEPYDDEEDIEEDDLYEEVLEDVELEEPANIVDVDDSQEDSLLASAARAALNLSDPLALLQGSAKKEQETLNKSDKWPEVPKVKVKPQNESHPAIDNNSTDVILRKLNEMTSLIHSQQVELKSLRKEVQGMKKKEKENLEYLVKKNGQQLSETVKKDAKFKQDQLLQTLGGKLEATVRTEVKKVLSQTMKDALQQVTSTLELDLRQRVAKSDKALVEGLTKVAQSKSVADSLTQSLSYNIQPLVQAAFKDTFTSVLIPAFERSLQAMLTQMSQSFIKGNKDVETQLKKHLEGVFRDQHKHLLDPLLREVRDRLADPKRMEQLLPAIREVISSEMRRNISATPTVIGSPAVVGGANVVSSPSFVDLQRAVQHHLGRGDVDNAFQTALSANSLSLVVGTCEMVNPMQVFNQTPCPLSQPVLLALIQQLSHNLEDKTEVKHKYLEESVMALHEDTSPAHLKTVLGGLQMQLEQYIRTHPNQKMTKQMKMLQMAAASLLGGNKAA